MFTCVSVCCLWVCWRGGQCVSTRQPTTYQQYVIFVAFLGVFCESVVIYLLFLFLYTSPAYLGYEFYMHTERGITIATALITSRAESFWYGKVQVEAFM